MERLINLTKTDAVKIRARQKAGSMSELYDEDGYLCYSKEELEKWESKKKGRKPVRVAKFSGSINNVLKEIKSVIDICNEKNITTLAELIEYENYLETLED